MLPRKERNYHMSKPRKSYYFWIVGKVLYALFALGIFLMVVYLLWRIYFSDNIPKELEGLSPNAVLADTYETYGDDMRLQTQEQGTITRNENNYGYFAVPQFVFIPEANQVQVLLRYNNSTLKATAKDFGLSEQPPKGEIVYDVSLLQITDLTPEDLSDNKDGSEMLGEHRIHPTSYTVQTTTLYTFILYTFDNVTVTDDTLVVYFDIYYGGAVDYEATAYGTLRLYHNESDWLEVEFKKSDKKALQAYKEQGE